MYKALDLAGLEGKVVVVDSLEGADAVLTTRIKRTGKAIDLAPVRQAAAAAGIPYIVLRAVSAQRVLEALGPMIGLQPDSLSRRLDMGSSAPATAPQLLRRASLMDDGGDQLMSLLARNKSGMKGLGNEQECEDRALRMTDPLQWLQDMNVEDDRQHMLPSNPNAVIGSKHEVYHPVQPGSRVRKRKLMKELADKNAYW